MIHLVGERDKKNELRLGRTSEKIYIETTGNKPVYLDKHFSISLLIALKRYIHELWPEESTEF